MAQSAAAATMMYGADAMGIADSLLHTARTAAAQAAAPEAGGKHFERTLYAVDAGGGTVDPAFMAHILPVKYWALAWWECWACGEELTNAYWSALRMLKQGKGADWAKVTGPASAIILTLRRIGWALIDEKTISTDEGQIIDLLLDPPAVTVKAVRNGVRRCRLRNIMEQLPTVKPTRPDVRITKDETYATVDFTSAFGSLTTGRAKVVKHCSEWSSSCRGYLVSAISGGQWWQTRRAAVPKWGITDKSCQLCGAEVGTALHRYDCSMTKPTGGWSKPPPAAAAMIAKLPGPRMDALRTTGIVGHPSRVCEQRVPR